LWIHSRKVAELLRSAVCLHTNQSRSYLNHLVLKVQQGVFETYLIIANKMSEEGH